MKKRSMIEISVALALVFAFAISAVGFGRECEKVRGEVVRLHVLANSDSEADQAVKLLVRDALLGSGSELFSGEVTARGAADCLNANADKLKAVAEKVLRDNGFDYGADIRLVNEYFTTRSYEGFTLPAGRYTAVKVVLGSGKGHNWWCVMFPPLCLPAAQDRGGNLDTFFDDGELKVVESSGRYEPRFKIVEIIEKLKEKTSFEN